MKKLALLLGLSLSILAKAQQPQCGTDQAMHQLFTAKPELREQFLKNEAMYDRMTPSVDKDGNTVYIIPVVFHVLHQNGPENISDAQIEDGIRILNRDMRKLNADTADVIDLFKPLVSDIKIEFRLATIDPNGNCTNGIDRIYSSRTTWANDSAKLNPWPREKYLNIWTAQHLSTGWAAYAYYPSAAQADSIMHDGIMTLADYVGSIGSSTEYKSRTLTHEVGHWLDLGHPWNRTINISINVALYCGDDGVDDTPITKGHQTCPDLLTPDCNNDTLIQGILTFSGVSTSSGTTDNTAIPFQLEKLVADHFEAKGVSANATENGAFAFSGWGTGAPDGASSTPELTGSIDLNKYYEFTIAPDTGNSMQLSGMGFRVRRSANGPRSFAVRTSVTNFGNNSSANPSSAGLSNETGTLFFKADDDKTLADAYFNIITSHSTEPITVRVYAWNAESAAGSFSIDSAYISGYCGIVENIQNYMEYSYCTNMWTKGQRDRMRVAIENSLADRNNLWSAANLAATGVTTPLDCKPQPDFRGDNTLICAGSTVKFTKQILNAPENSLSWTFEGGTPASSTATSPSVRYDTPGTYAVTLSATNDQGTGTTTKTEYITVHEAAADHVVTTNFTEAFEVAATFDDEWTVVNYDNNKNTWKRVDNAGINGTGAVKLDGFGSYQPDKDDLISPVFDMTAATSSSVFSFKYAGANKGAAGSAIDELTIYYSTNCGLTWQPRSKVKGTALFKNPVTKTEFVPDAQTIWTTKTVTIPAEFRTSQLSVKLQYAASDSSNNVYIDDINIGVPNGISEENAPLLSAQLFPNPTNGDFEVSFELENASSVEFSLINTLGETVNSFTKDLGAGENHQEFNGTELPSGLYLVRISSGNSFKTLKVLIR